jgi:hypothetical protein
MMDKLATDTAGKRLDDTSRCRPAELVEHAHTRAEHALYAALWNFGGSPDHQDPYRDVTIGYDKLAALVRTSKRTVQRLGQSLQRKLAIEVLQPENCGIRQGKTYRVYGTAEVLRRRMEAGYLWSLSNRSAVELVKMTSLNPPATAASLATEQPPRSADSANEVTLPAPLPTTLAKIRTFLNGDAAAQELIARCRSADPQATDEEILYFLELRVAQLRQRPPVGNWMELLLTSVPRYFQPPVFELERYRAEHRR